MPFSKYAFCPQDQREDRLPRPLQNTQKGVVLPKTNARANGDTPRVVFVTRPLLFFTLVGRIPIHSPNTSQSYPNINDIASGSFVYIFATRHKRRYVYRPPQVHRFVTFCWCVYRPPQVQSLGIFTDLLRSRNASRCGVEKHRVPHNSTQTRRQ